MGVHCVELDVYFVDGQLVVFHDDDLERTTNGAGKIQEQSFEYLRSLDCGQGQRMPTLGEVVELLDRRVGLNIELKGPGTAAPVVAAIQSMRAAGWTDAHLLVSSFDHAQLRQARSLDPQIKIGALYFQPPQDVFESIKGLKAFSFNAGVWFIEAEMVEQAQALGLRVYVYTVNESADIRRMRALGVDGVFTNYPDRVLDGQPGAVLPAAWS
jgi:glycerophosphoryl diester phosphodiesterase